jgi:hypothetical protein
LVRPPPLDFLGDILIARFAIRDSRATTQVSVLWRRRDGHWRY